MPGQGRETGSGIRHWQLLLLSTTRRGRRTHPGFPEHLAAAQERLWVLSVAGSHWRSDVGEGRVGGEIREDYGPKVF